MRRVSATLVLACILAFLTVRFADIDGTSDLEVLRIRAGAESVRCESRALMMKRGTPARSQAA